MRRPSSGAPAAHEVEVGGAVDPVDLRPITVVLVPLGIVGMYQGALDRSDGDPRVARQVVAIVLGVYATIFVVSWLLSLGEWEEDECSDD